MNPPGGTSRILRNASSSWLGHIFRVCVVLLLTPFVLAELGTERYSIWLLVSTLTGYYGLFSLGSRGAISQYLTRYLADGDKEKLCDFGSTATTIMIVLAIVVIGVGVTAAAMLRQFVALDPSAYRDAQLCCVLASLSTAVELAISVYSSVFIATKRFDMDNLIGVLTTLTHAVFTYLLIKNGHGLLGLAISVSGTNILTAVVRVSVAGQLAPCLKIMPGRFKTEHAWSMLNFGVWSSLVTVSQTLFLYTDNLVIFLALPVSAIATYSLAASIAWHLQSFLKPVARVYYPELIDHHTRNDTQRFRQTAKNGCRALVTLTCVATAIATAAAPSFFANWLQSDASFGDVNPGQLAVILLCASGTRLYSGVIPQVLLGALEVRTYALIALAEAVANVVLSILLVQFLGLQGIAYATLMTCFVARVIIDPLVAAKFTGLSALRYAIQIAFAPLAHGVAIFLVVQWIFSMLPPPSLVHWTFLVSAMTVACIPSSFFIGLSRQDRQELFDNATRFLRWSKDPTSGP